MPTDDELTNACFDGWWRDFPAPREPWTQAAKAVASLVAPEGSVVVDRARFERLREFADAVMNLEAVEPRSAVDDPAWSRWRAASAALQPGDRDPLP